MSNNVYYIPNGPKNLQPLFPGVNFNNVSDYYLEICDNTCTPIATTTVNKIEKCNPDDFVRIHFVNYLGAVDAINFIRSIETTEVKSGTWERPLTYPLTHSYGGLYRTDIHSREGYKVFKVITDETEMQWIKELIASPMAWIEWTGTQGQSDDYIQIIIKDGKVVTKKSQDDDSFLYEFSLDFELANEHFVLRN